MNFRGRSLPFRFKIYLTTLAGIALIFLPGVLDIVTSDWNARMAPSLSSEAQGHYEFIKHHLQQPFKGYNDRQTLIDGFRIVMLSHMACGLANVARIDPSKKAEAISLIEEVIRRAISSNVAPFPKFVERSKYWKKENLYLSHLNLILGAYRVAGGDDRFDALHKRISEHLSEAILKEPDFTLESFGGGDKWPADQTPTLLSLYMYDKSHNTTLSTKPIAGWLAFMKNKMTDPKLHVHESYFSPHPIQRRPRGCALSWSTLYMAQFAPRQARELYANYRKTYFRHWCGLGGFREWPPNENYGMNSDTGPILFGIGFAASGFAIGPARLFSDSEAYKTVMRTGALIGCPIRWQSQRWYLLAPLLGEAIIFNGETATPWFPEFNS